MKVCFGPYLWLTVLMLTTTAINAQQKNKDSASGKSYWQVDLTYQNDNVYLGRKDSVQLPYITPSISYYNKSGLFLTTSLSYLTASANNRIDLFTIEGGYQYQNKNFEAQISGIKYFYNSQSNSVKSNVKGALDAYNAFDFGFLKPSLEGTVNISTKSDIVLTLGLEHTFYAIDNKLDVTPFFFLNAGTQNYYGLYYNKRRRKKKRVAGGNYYDISTQVTNASTLKLLDYEIDLPISYTYKNFSFNFTPSFAIPVNPATLMVTVKTSSGNQFSTTYPEKLSNLFYYSFGVGYKFSIAEYPFPIS